MELCDHYRAAIAHGRARLVHPREEDVRRAIARKADFLDRHTPHGGGDTRLMLLINAVEIAYSEPWKPEPLVRQGWGPLVARVARQMGVLA